VRVRFTIPFDSFGCVIPMLCLVWSSCATLKKWRAKNSDKPKRGFFSSPGGFPPLVGRLRFDFGRAKKKKKKKRGRKT
jgi:hypothetical protein